MFLNTGMASPLTDSQRAVFESYFREGGGFVGIGSAIETDPSWEFLSDVLGTRASGRTALQSGTMKVFDRVHDASKSLPLYWDRTDHWYNLDDERRRQSHVLASVVEDPFGPQPQGAVLDGIEGGTMGAQHPVSFCKDYQGGRSFYTALGNTPEAFDATLTTHLKGAITWAAGTSDPVYSDCGATVLANYQQTKVGTPPNLQEPIGFDQLPDGRIIQTDRLRLAAPARPGHGHGHGDRRLRRPSLPLTQRIYDAGEDGLYGPAVDANFATNKWVYLFYSPQTVIDVKLSDGAIVTQTTPKTNPPNTAASKAAWDPYVGYHQLSRFKFVEDANGPRLDLSCEQQILKVPMNRQECCHVAGDIDFDKHGNLWLVTGDDTPAGGINAGGYGPFNDQKTDEQQTVRVTNATGGTFTLTFNGQTTAPLPYNASRDAIDAALEALSNVGADNIQVSGSTAVNTNTVNVFFRRALQQSDQNQITGDGSGLEGTGATLTTATAQAGRLVSAADRRLPPQRAEHQRPARQGAAVQGQGRRHHRRRRQQGRLRLGHRRVHDPVREPVPARRGRPAGQDPARGLRDGLPQPVPHPGGRERRRVRQRLLAGRRTPARRAARRAPAATRSCASRPTTAGRRATSATWRTTSGTSTSSRPAPRRPARR